MAAHTYLITKATRSLKSDTETDKPYYEVVDVFPMTLPFTHVEKFDTYTYHYQLVEHEAEIFFRVLYVKIEHENNDYSTISVPAWAPDTNLAQELLVEIVNKEAANVTTEEQTIKPQWVYDAQQNCRGAAVQWSGGRVWFDVVAVKVEPRIKFGDGLGQVLVEEERSMGQDSTG
ncbi:hypothetical protein K458DRAFT_410015 [Lentithecium fluviatile CBS 122367]|uniref:Uncharacterized protein n=1 Tax=Lentithecium fluviatile CBS 122367 TaxID=1168545 RepID=A0A6G1IGU2_9PLEO|nr:hypothetical protein K458DRAFT_410015 [Lentithecium fluviatile CBS 122367]